MKDALRKVRRRGMAICLGLLLPAAMAQTPSPDKPWPSAPIKVIVPYAPGGGTDVAARLMARKLQESLKQTVIVDNRPGGRSIIAYEAALREPADGHTFVFNNSSHSVQATYKRLPYDIVADFVPVSPIANSSVVLVVPPDSAAKTLQEFVEQVRQKPAKVAFGSFGVGTTSHLYGEILNAAARIDMLHIAYKGSAPALSDLMGGHVQALFVDGIAAKPLVESGKVRALAITGVKRWKAYPTVPTFGELGYADLGKPGWWGFVARKSVPPQIVARMSEEIRKIVAMPDVAAALGELGAEAHADTPADFAATVQGDVVRWRRIVQDRNLSVE
ncbi:tripartite tricarboxylate transporter substrate binding protein [Piscinibacter sp. XHJ-5]|uniref:Bug family tripartite tricarboxylate transporter substrate binding protein n=1 Tax=Piscinibacter sp. XHJ-5 TaxID=3037797 RepID=UPI002453412C|nr:tripartite tricarboxylate transporter substrate binding protein [Piscinibacter sp. XHJ-5]